MPSSFFSIQAQAGDIKLAQKGDGPNKKMGTGFTKGAPCEYSSKWI